MAFKDSLSKLTKSLSEGASTVVQKSNDLIEVTKLNGEIDIEERKKEQIFLDMGKLVYDGYINKTNVSAEIKSKCEALLEHNEQIKKIQKQILVLKKLKKCSNCGTEMSIDINFCPSCGNKQELVISHVSQNFSDSIEDDDTL
jgi:rubrerythrin